MTTNYSTSDDDELAEITDPASVIAKLRRENLAHQERERRLAERLRVHEPTAGMSPDDLDALGGALDEMSPDEAHAEMLRLGLIEKVSSLRTNAGSGYGS